jgi:hypothetical protein
MRRPTASSSANSILTGISSLRFGNHKPTPAIPKRSLFGRKKLAVVDELVTGSKVAARHQFVRLRKVQRGRGHEVGDPFSASTPPF